MAKKLDELHFVFSTADPDIWLQPAVKPDGSKHCECVLCCVDDILAIVTDPGSVPEGLKGGTVWFENDKIEVPVPNCKRKPSTTLNAGPSPVSKLQ